MYEYDFKNHHYDVAEEVDRAWNDPEVALWFTRHMNAFELARVFRKALAVAMDEIQELEGE